MSELSKVAVQLWKWKQILVDFDNCIQSTIPDLKRRHMGQEVIAYQETHEDKVIHNSFKIESKRKMYVFEFKSKILSHHRYFNELEFNSPR